jgi:uncharacterized protein (DUF1800 family)
MSWRGCRKYLRQARRISSAIAGALGWTSMAASLMALPWPAVNRDPASATIEPASSRAPAAPPLAPEWNQPLAPDQKILQLLNRITFGPRPGDVERVRAMGIDAFLDEQLHPERISDPVADARVSALETYSMSTQELFADYPQPKPAAQPPAPEPAAMTALGAAESGGIRPASGAPRPAATAAPAVSGAPLQGPRRVMMELGQEELLRAVYSNRQLEEVMVQFWMNHFNIFAPKGMDKWALTSFERDAIRPHALGKFEDLLVATAESPAMLFYLDNWMSAAPEPSAPPAREDRHARLANPWWRPGPGSGRSGRWRHFGPPVAGRPPSPGRKKANRRGLNENYARELMELHTLGVDGGYTQQDVIEVARCLTGWTIHRPAEGGDFYFNPRMHDWGDKVVLGHTIRAAGMAEGLQVLHILATSPATARHIAFQLCQRFVADEPPPSVVNRAAAAFEKTRGDLRAVLRTILTSPEFNSVAAYRAKVKSPLELVAGALRALGAETDGGEPLLQFLARMGQPLFMYPAPSGWPDRAGAWIDSGSLLARWQFAAALAAGRIRGTAVDWKDLNPGPDAFSPAAALDQLAALLTPGSLSPSTRRAILNRFPAEGGGPSQTVDSARAVPEIAALLVASPDFQRR